MVVLPEKFIERMRTMLGEEAERFFESYENERTFGLRINPCKVTKEWFERQAPFSLKKIPWAKDGYFYGREDRPGKHPWHEAGLYYIQEPSAMLPAELLGSRPKESILDLCAAPGGKSTQIAAAMRGEGRLVCNEIHPERAKILSQNMERLGFAHALVLNETPASLAERFPQFFDRIMVDAPCSGEGMFRKDEEARKQWSEEQVELCAKRQDEILDCAFRMLKAGGRLVYSTCTFAPEEDEGSVLRFLMRHPQMKLVSGKEAAKEVGIEAENLLGTSQGRLWEGLEVPEEEREEWQRELAKTFRVWPHRTQGEGHYIAVLEKEKTPESQGEAEDVKEKKKDRNEKNENKEKKQNEEDRQNKQNRQNIQNKQNREKKKVKREQKIAMPDSYREFIEQSMTEPLRWMKEERLLLFGEQLYYLPEGWDSSLAGVKVLRAGLHMGTCKKNRFEPSHALALHSKKEDVYQSVSLDSQKEELRKYLNGQTLPCEADGMKGWVLVLVDGFSLGWMKAAGGSLKNHYPKGLRTLI